MNARTKYSGCAPANCATALPSTNATACGIEDRLNDWDRKRSAMTKAVDLTRRLRHAMLSDTTIPRFVAVCAPDEAAAAAPLIARLGPRASVRADPAVAQGLSDIVEA